MRRLLAVRRPPGARGFSYEDTLAYRLYGPKPLAALRRESGPVVKTPYFSVNIPIPFVGGVAHETQVVVHPVITHSGTKPWPQILWDAEEALGSHWADLLRGLWK